MNVIRRVRLFVAACALLVGVGGMVPAVALAGTPQSVVCSTLGSNANCTKAPPNSTSLNDVIKAIVNIFSYVIGVVAVIMIMVGGFRYVTSGGDSSKVSSAKNTLIYAVIGLVVTALSQIIVWFVLAKIE